MVALIILISGCTSSTEYGECIGLADEKNPDLIYKVSAWNVFVAVVTFELIAPPIFVVVDETFCPIGRKDKVEEKKNDNPGQAVGIWEH